MSRLTLNPIKEIGPLQRHFFLSLILILLAGFGVFASERCGEYIATSWTRNLKKEFVDKTNTSNWKSFIDEENLQASEAEKTRLNTQIQIIEYRALSSLAIAKDFYKWLFATIMSFSISIIIASLCLFSISKEGWKVANNYVINVFTVFSSIALLSGSIPLVFQYENNAQKNLEMLVNYINLRNQVITSIAIAGNLEGKSLTLKDIVVSTEIALAKYHQISIQLDTSRMLNPQQIIDKLEATQ
ncbi:MAG: hypothetical protein WBF90_31570 [Rivularia sp. (in: cyanobacteria)]